MQRLQQSVVWRWSSLRGLIGCRLHIGLRWTLFLSRVLHRLVALEGAQSLFKMACAMMRHLFQVLWSSCTCLGLLDCFLMLTYKKSSACVFIQCWLLSSLWSILVATQLLNRIDQSGMVCFLSIDGFLVFHKSHITGHSSCNWWWCLLVSTRRNTLNFFNWRVWPSAWLFLHLSLWVKL